MERLLVAVTDHRDVRLIAAGDRHHIIGTSGGGQALGLTERRQRLVIAALLRQCAAGQRVHQREIALVADRVQRRRGFGEMVGHRPEIADQLVAAGELEVGKTDGAEIVRDFGLFQRPSLEGDGARLIAARRREPAMQPPEVRKNGWSDRFTQRVRRASERRAGLGQVVLQQPRFGQDGTKRELVGPRQ